MRIEKIFPNLTEAFEFLETEKTCGFQYKNETNEGNKWNYRCNKVKLRAKQCSAVIFLLFDNRNTEVVELTILTIIWIKIKNRINRRSKSKSKIGDSKIV